MDSIAATSHNRALVPVPYRLASAVLPPARQRYRPAAPMAADGLTKLPVHTGHIIKHSIYHLDIFDLHYYHQVLLDYLISKDIGTSCAEYLLKCLCIVCDKWNNSCVQQESTSEFSSDEIPLSPKPDRMNQETCKQQFHAARDCLLMLKKSVESLC
ncbi:hypothetical protein OSB04_000061 [Centaurea solstitialis]|uniref:Uncharacterized protein n=1 Tax=Centaurea solstitialis TaxID=347529 RepID=A0AA38WRW4_9ASTR|nr:hypothetical protein OSB04_000061 [Centaurea solstitialis]